MECKKCGKKINKTDKFCQYCGTEVSKDAVVSEPKSKVEKVVEKKEEPKVETVKTASENKPSKGLAIAGMAVGIVGLLFSLIFGPFAFVLPVVGLILSLCAKGNSGFKTAGIITSIVAFVIEIIITVFGLAFFTSIMGIVEDEIRDYDYDYNYTYKDRTPYGEWTCVPYPSYKYDAESTTLDLKYSSKYIYGPTKDLDKNYYAGTFTYETDYTTNDDVTLTLNIKAPVTEFVLDGVNQSIYGKNLNMKMKLIDDFDSAIVTFDNTNSSYECTR